MNKRLASDNVVLMGICRKGLNRFVARPSSLSRPTHANWVLRIPLLILFTVFEVRNLRFTLLHKF